MVWRIKVCMDGWMNEPWRDRYKCKDEYTCTRTRECNKEVLSCLELLKRDNEYSIPDQVMKSIE